MADQPTETFDVTNGRVTGVLVLVMCALVVVFGVMEAPAHVAVPLVLGAVFVAVLAWASMLRPRVWLTSGDLVLRTMLETVRLPLEAIENVAVRRFLAVGVGGKRYACPAVSRSLRRVARSEMRWRPAATLGPFSPGASAAPGDTVQADPGELYYPDFVEQQIQRRAREAREAAGIEDRSDEQLAAAAGVRREPAWPVIAALAVTGVAFVVSLLV